MKTPALSPAAAHFECIASARRPDYNDDLLACIPSSVGRLLDAGCASGRFTLSIAHRATFLVGMDLSSDLIRMARERRQNEARANVHWVVGDIERPPFQEQCFDLVVSVNVLRLTNFPLALQEVAQLVKPGGRVAIKDLVRNPHRILGPSLLNVYWMIRSAPRYWRLFGPWMMLRILAYRMSRDEWERNARVHYMTFDGIEESYHRIMPGSTLKKTQWGYLAVWNRFLSAIDQE